jgi:hypothetical protein
MFPFRNSTSLLPVNSVAIFRLSLSRFGDEHPPYANHWKQGGWMGIESLHWEQSTVWRFPKVVLNTVLSANALARDDTQHGTALSLISSS